MSINEDEKKHNKLGSDNKKFLICWHLFPTYLACFYNKDWGKRSADDVTRQSGIIYLNKQTVHFIDKLS